MGMSARRKKLFSTDKQRYAPQSNDMHRKATICTAKAVVDIPTILLSISIR
jgi:hypothetical protein